MGSEQYFKNIESVMSKHNLFSNIELQQLLLDIFVNTTDVSSQGRIKAVVLERFLVLL